MAVSTFIYIVMSFFSLFGVILKERDFVAGYYFVGPIGYYYLPTMISFLVAIPINIVIIYRLVRREAVMNNFQKAIIFQSTTIIGMTLSDHGIKVCYTHSMTQLRQTFHGLQNTFRDIELCAICVFAIYWKNIFIQHRKCEIAAYMYLALAFTYRFWGNIRLFLHQYYSELWDDIWAWELDYLGRVYQVIPIIFALGVLLTAFACFLTLMMMKTKAYSPQVLKGIRKMSLAIFLKCLFVIPVFAQIIWLYFPYYFPSTEDFFKSDKFKYIDTRIDSINKIILSLYPLYNSILTWYSIGGLLKQQTKSKSTKVYSITSLSKLTSKD